MKKFLILYLRKLFSVINENNHKVWTILGVKIKYKYSNNIFILYKKNGNIIKKPKIKGLEVKFYGSNSKIEIYEPYHFINAKINLGNNCSVKFTDTQYIYNDLFIQADFANNLAISFGRNTSCGGLSIRAISANNFKIDIGNECAISTNVLIQPIDGHWILNNETREIVNFHQKDIKIGNHVWIGRNVTINKNVEIACNSVIALGSIVTKQIHEKNVIIAGVPARIVKRNVDWQR